MAYSIIGIDFGTSTTVVNVKNYYEGMQENECHTLSINGHPLLPTVIFERIDDGRMFYGFDAISERDNGSNGIFHQNFKMDLINNDDQIREKAKLLVKEFIKYLYSEFDKQKSFLHVFPSTKTYISYPAKWAPDIVSFMKNCVVEAGFGDENTVFGETEPTAAVYAAFENHSTQLKQQRLIVQNEPLNVMMLDMGAGTSDIAIFKFKVDNENNFSIGYNNQIVTYPSVNNRSLCGGREIDALLSKYLMDYVRGAIKTEYSGFTNQIEKSISQSVKIWKEANISPKLTANGTVDTIPAFLTMYKSIGVLQDKPFRPINRSTFEDLISNFKEQLYNLIKGSIEKATEIITGLEGPEDIDLVILTGGHSNWYFIEKYFKEGIKINESQEIKFQKIIDNNHRFIHEERPQETVANGLIYHDLNFDIAHTSSNNIWIKLSINNQESEVMELLGALEPIPISKNAPEFSMTIHDSTYTEKKAKVKYHLYVGETIETAVCTSGEVEFDINDFLLAILGTPFRLIGDLLGEPDAFEDTYRIIVKTGLAINEDGSGTLSIKCSSTYNTDVEPIIIKI